MWRDSEPLIILSSVWNEKKLQQIINCGNLRNNFEVCLNIHLRKAVYNMTQCSIRVCWTEKLWWRGCQRGVTWGWDHWASSSSHQIFAEPVSEHLWLDHRRLYRGRLGEEERVRSVPGRGVHLDNIPHPPRRGALRQSRSPARKPEQETRIHSLLKGLFFLFFLHNYLHMYVCSFRIGLTWKLTAARNTPGVMTGNSILLLLYQVLCKSYIFEYFFTTNNYLEQCPCFDSQLKPDVVKPLWPYTGIYGYILSKH